jgi:hypothetical protein
VGPVVAAVDGASHALDGVVQGFVLTWPINAAFLAAAGARANRAVLPSWLGWSALAAAMLVVGAPLSGRAGARCSWCSCYGLAASFVLLRHAARPVAARTRPMEPAAAGRWQALSSALLGRPI